MMSGRRSRSFASHAATYAIGNAARRFVGFAMLPIYTRFLTPADYGVVSLLIFGVALLEPLLGARLGWAIPKFYFSASDDRGRRTVIWGAFGLTGAASVLSVIVLVLFRNEAASILFGDRKYALALGLFAVTLLSQPIEQAGMTYLRLRERSGMFLAFSVGKLVLQLGLNLLLVVYWRGEVLGVVLSAVISSLLLGIAATIYVAAQEAPAFDWQVTRSMVKFCWPLWLSAIAGLYIGSSSAFFLRVFDSLSDVGLLQLALKFATTVATLIWAPFFQHWEPMSYKYAKEVNGKRKFQVAFIAISALMFAAGLGISIFSQPVIRLMSTKAFYGAASVVPLLVLGAIFNNLRSFFNFGFMVTGRTEVQSWSQYGSAVGITIAYLLLIPLFGLMGAAAARCLAFGATFIFVYALSRRYYDPEINLFPIGVFSVIGFGAYFFANVALRVPNLGIDLLIKSVVMVIATLLIALVALRSIRAVDVSMLESLPWPLHKLGRMQLMRLSGN
jgi:O-antigen/teichoic acid export membrane protein